MLSTYLEEAFAAQIQEVIEGHLHSCTRCRDELRRLHWTISHLSKLPRRAAHPEYARMLLQLASAQ